MFLGEHFHTLDKKGRVIFPAKYRENLKDGLVVTIGVDNCLTVFTKSFWPQVSERIMQINPEYDSRTIARAIFANAFEGTPDKQGRLTIPQNLRDYAGIKDEVVISGLSTHLEIWNSSAWKEYREKANPAFNQIKAGFSELGF
jgi:MraZ protein